MYLQSFSGQDDYPTIGVPEIDREHLALANELRKLLAAVKDDDRELTVVVAGNLIECANEHFAHEERLMRESRFAGSARHKQSHDEFLTKARLHFDELRANGLNADCLRWVATTMDWFRSHVRVEDSALARALTARAGTPRDPCTDPTTGYGKD